MHFSHTIQVRTSYRAGAPPSSAVARTMPATPGRASLLSRDCGAIMHSGVGGGKLYTPDPPELQSRLAGAGSIPVAPPPTDTHTALFLPVLPAVGIRRGESGLPLQHSSAYIAVK